MTNIKTELKELVQDCIVPEVESYLEELHELLEKGEETSEDMQIITEMEDFLVELENILQVIEEDKATPEEYKEIYDKIMASMDHDHSHDEGEEETN